MGKQPKHSDEGGQPNAFQQRVRDRLHELGRDAFEAARLGDFSDRRFIYDIVKLRKRSVRGENLLKLAKALDLRPADLVEGGVEEPTLEPDIVLPPPGLETPAPLLGNRNLEVRGISIGSEDDEAGEFTLNGQVIDYVHRPAALAHRRDVFVVYTANSSMIPVFEPGDPIIVESRREPMPGDDVIVELFGEDGAPGPAYIKRLVRRAAAKVVVKQFNPEKEIEFDRSRIKKLWRVIPRKELV